MSLSSIDTLIKMINQIALNNGAYEDGEAIDRVATHIQRFWAKKMRADLIEYLQNDGEKLNPVAKAAAEKVMASQAAA